jgi:hypothetical protein
MAEVEFKIHWSEEEREIAGALEPVSRTQFECLDVEQLAELLEHMVTLLRAEGLLPHRKKRAIPGLESLSEIAAQTLSSNMCSTRIWS